jgi:UDP-N-acetylmuramyl pentapeptide phosphotransferase/UDP-N-acetylglucosamine-1-phosphate transferase
VLLLGAILPATAVLTALAISSLIPLLRRRRILDRPNARSSHSMPTPRGGGIAVMGVLLPCWAVLAATGNASPALFAIVVGAAGLAAVSWLDDLYGLSPGLRLLAHAAAVALGLAALPLPDLPGDSRLLVTAYLLAAGAAWLWWLNLFNFMDGIDGLAGSEAAAIAVGIQLLCLTSLTQPQTAPLAAAVLGAALGFLLWNWAPARIFLGDVGSVPLGYALGYLLLSLAIAGQWRAAAILPLYFIADATITLLRRLLCGERVWQAHRSHFYQQAVRRGRSHAAVVVRVLIADLLLIGCAWAAESGAGPAALAVAGAVVAILLALLARGR